MREQIRLNVPLEYVEDAVAETHYLSEPIEIDDVAFDRMSRMLVVNVDVESADAIKLPWIETDYEDVAGVPV
jgi:hypothetical protein